MPHRMNISLYKENNSFHLLLEDLNSFWLFHKKKKVKENHQREKQDEESVKKNNGSVGKEKMWPDKRKCVGNRYLTD